MPTFTTIALETLIEPRTRDFYKNSSNSNQQHTSKSLHDNDDEEERNNKKKPPTPNHIFISPALYVTPQPTPIPYSSSDPLSPSPYVVNSKRRRGGKVVNRKVDGSEIQKEPSEDEEGKSNGGGELRAGEMVDDNLSEGVRNEQDSVVEDDFFDLRCDSFSVASSTELNDSISGRQVENLCAAVSNQGEFFDADEDFSSDGSFSNVTSCVQSIESELRATRLSLLEEIERRKTSEDALGLMYSQWQTVGNLLSQAGLTFPKPSNARGVQLEIDLIEQLSQEVVVARFVAEAIGKGQARAEAELAAEVIIESKDQEISRLRDRLQYHEAVNREMFQRNQEVMQVARQQRHRKKGRQRWLWGCIGLSIMIGASVIAYSCLPQTSTYDPLLSSSDPSDASDIGSSQSA